MASNVCRSHVAMSTYGTDVPNHLDHRLHALDERCAFVSGQLDSVPSGVHVYDGADVAQRTLGVHGGREVARLDPALRDPVLFVCGFGLAP
jgi:hypothetical protein